MNSWKYAKLQLLISSSIIVFKMKEIMFKILLENVLTAFVLWAVGIWWQ